MYQPEIPPNTGNIIRLCANTGAKLHLVHPLGFSLDAKNLRRAKLDYQDLTHVTEYQSLSECLQQLDQTRVFALTTKCQTAYTSARFQANDSLLFGPETRGLPQDILAQYQNLTIPMVANSRSLNLSNSVAVVLYEALRQLNTSFFQ